MHIFGRLWEYLARRGIFWRIIIKACILMIFILAVLFPNPVLLIRQLVAYGNLDALIQNDFEGIEQINQDIDAMLPETVTRKQEFDIVQQYVYEHIPYAYDWDNWLNVDYWPTAAEVWVHKREDCDGRAVLAASILRSRGFSSARLAGNIRHIWVAVDRDTLMGAEPEETIRREDGKTQIVLPSWELALGSLAIGIADFQTVRSLLLYFGILLVCYHPRRDRSGFFGLATLGVVGFTFLRDWAELVLETYTVTITISFWAGGILLLSSIILAWCMPVFVKQGSS